MTGPHSQRHKLPSQSHGHFAVEFIVGEVGDRKTQDRERVPDSSLLLLLTSEEELDFSLGRIWKKPELYRVSQKNRDI